MKRKFRTQCVLLGLLCLMPALFFWALETLPVEMNTAPLFIFFSETTLVEFIICGFVFPVLAVGLGFNAYLRCEDKLVSLVVVAVGIIEITAAAAAIHGMAF